MSLDTHRHRRQPCIGSERLCQRCWPLRTAWCQDQVARLGSALQFSTHPGRGAAVRHYHCLARCGGDEASGKQGKNGENLHLVGYLSLEVFSQIWTASVGVMCSRVDTGVLYVPHVWRLPIQVHLPHLASAVFSRSVISFAYIEVH